MIENQRDKSTFVREEILKAFPEEAIVVDRSELLDNVNTPAAALGLGSLRGAGVAEFANNRQWLDLEVARKLETTQGDNSHNIPETFQAG